MAHQGPVHRSLHLQCTVPMQFRRAALAVRLLLHHVVVLGAGRKLGKSQNKRLANRGRGWPGWDHGIAGCARRRSAAPGDGKHLAYAERAADLPDALMAIQSRRRGTQAGPAGGSALDHSHSLRGSQVPRCRVCEDRSGDHRPGNTTDFCRQGRLRSRLHLRSRSYPAGDGDQYRVLADTSQHQGQDNLR